MGGKRGLEAERQVGNNKAERVGGGEVEMEMVPMNSSHETEGKFLKDSKLGHDRTLSTF